jgi:hypothetical protein
MKLYIFVPVINTYMKIKSLIITLLIFETAGVLYSQEKQLFGFGDLDWNSSKEEVKDFMKNKYDLLPGYEKDDAIGYQGGSYLKQELFLWVYFFDEKGLQEADLVVKNSAGPAGGIFYEVVHNLTVEYGDPDLYKPDDWTAEWFYYDFPGKHLNATIKVSPYSNDEMTTIKISFLKVR